MVLIATPSTAAKWDDSTWEAKHMPSAMEQLQKVLIGPSGLARSSHVILHRSLRDMPRAFLSGFGPSWGSSGAAR